MKQFRIKFIKIAYFADICSYLQHKYVDTVLKISLFIASVWLCLGGLLYCIETFAAVNNPAALPKLNLDKDITVSGLSSGGYMATQFHLAHAEAIQGAGIIGAGPYFCSEGSLITAEKQCLDRSDSQPPVSELLKIAKERAQQKQLDDLTELQNDAIWVYHGTKDKLVAAPVTNALVDFYKGLVPEKNITYINTVASGHGFPTLNTGVECAQSAIPYINKCNYDAAGALLEHLLKNLKKPSDTTAAAQTFDQTLYNVEQAGLAKEGYVYIPSACTKGTLCKLHVSFHGCRQNAETLGTQFVENTGYNRWAESNNIVILYPQTTATATSNPEACWDWWGYTGEHFALRDGKQIQSVWNMILALQGGK